MKPVPTDIIKDMKRKLSEKAYENQMKAWVKRNNEKTRTFFMRLSVDTDSDVIGVLDDLTRNGESKQGYIKRLIREDIKKDGN